MSRHGPLIFDIRRFAFDDGPGIRTTVFFKGCPLACVWCHNPESVRRGKEIAYYPQKCIRCGDCSSACPTGAITAASDRIDRERCAACGNCAGACPATALKEMGVHYPAHRMLDLLLRDRLFYETSGGGVTFSGGEPTLHMDYLSVILIGLKTQGIHTAIQTCGFFDLTEFSEKLLPFLDLIFFDVKFIDSGDHFTHTGRSNDLILRNLELLLTEAPAKIVPRVPLVPGITATEKNLQGIGNHLKRLGVTELEQLPYNPGGIAKRGALDLPVPASLPVSILTADEEVRWRGVLANALC